jgi:phosphoribosylglycinamide formyltransferase-1
MINMTDNQLVLASPAADAKPTLPAKVVVLISGTGSNMRSLLGAAQDLGAPYQVVAVISNRPLAAGLVFAAQQHVATAVVDHTQYPSREAFDASLVACVATYKPDWVVLAGFMRVLTPVFIDAFAGRIVNIHPSLLPAFPGLHTHQQALQAGVRIHGATVHGVTHALDHGPILDQAVVQVLPDDTPETLGARVLQLEHMMYPRVVAALARGNMRLPGVTGAVEGALHVPLLHTLPNNAAQDSFSVDLS